MVDPMVCCFVSCCAFRSQCSFGWV